MQLDSLGYVHCGAVQQTGQYNIASNLYDVTLRFFTVNYKDVCFFGNLTHHSFFSVHVKATVHSFQLVVCDYRVWITCPSPTNLDHL